MAMSDVDRYITDEAVHAALADPDHAPCCPDAARLALRAALPGILAQHRADVLREVSLDLGSRTDTYPGLTDKERQGFAAAVRHTRRLCNAAEAVADA